MRPSTDQNRPKPAHDREPCFRPNRLPFPLRHRTPIKKRNRDMARDLVAFAPSLQGGAGRVGAQAKLRLSRDTGVASPNDITRLQLIDQLSQGRMTWKARLLVGRSSV